MDQKCARKIARNGKNAIESRSCDLGGGAVGGGPGAVAAGADAAGVEGGEAAEVAADADAAGGGKVRGGLHDGVAHLLGAVASAHAGITGLEGN